MGRHHYPYLPVIEPLVWDRWPLARQLTEEVRTPLLVLVGERDEIVPPQVSQQVYEAAADPKKFVEVPAAHHNDEALLAGEQMLAELDAFLGEWLR
jgi:fermentation-respiration switch protein FrsA (DUF1100 family)